VRLWRLSAGLGHGRNWARLTGLQPVAATAAPGGYMLEVQVHKDEVVGLARVCHGMIERAEQIYSRRCSSPFASDP
jgi:hypothetical protein